MAKTTEEQRERVRREIIGIFQREKISVGVAREILFNVVREIQVSEVKIPDGYYKD
ncbi:hypothetical protein [Caproiciproducens galactitolivorans]|uniref:Uncharacterized protein n=1 Tax=Caproiciproducens galactitolivorans TaxID=642589 RepID=A0A4Z0XXZ9_9FIRM|nr:hypothetical protein [Caproiciproducens galactitolivorans]TGJ75377.1 hypothetical protein CAGA_24760 [Caproiciproducens galactitolivorans]